MAGKTKTKSVNHLRAWRDRAKMTQGRLAELAGTTASVISEIESGKQALSDKWADTLAPILGTRWGFILRFDPDSVDRELLEGALNVPPERKAEAAEILRTISKRA